MSDKPARGRPPGRNYKALKTMLRELYINKGVSSGAISKLLDVPHSSLSTRFNEWGFRDEKVERDVVLVNQAIARFQEMNGGLPWERGKTKPEEADNE